MSKHARRGLGFVVLAFLLWLIALGLHGYAGDPVGGVLYALVGLAMVGCGLYGLVALAWGLIRD